MMTKSLETHKRNECIDITSQVRELISRSDIRNGIATVYVPHTTAAVTINENADPDVVHDLLLTLEDLIPHSRKGYRHAEGNSDAHVKTSLVGSSVTVIVENSRLVLGTWQAIFFCEFDGPRHRQFMVKLQSD